LERAVSAYPVAYEADYAERRNRLTIFLRWLLVIPHTIVLYLVGIAMFFTGVAAWFAVVITGRYPQGLYAFNANAIRWYARYSAYAYLQTDAFPPFGFGEHPEYPVYVRFAPPQASYSRAKAFFRLILAIPVWIVQYALTIVAFACAIAAWFTGVILGRVPRGVFDGIDLGLAYLTRSMAYFLLLTETWPPFTNSGEDAALLQPAGGAAIGPSGAWAPPAATERLERPESPFGDR
jgi:Domain of unknown function (DUF4389)